MLKLNPTYPNPTPGFAPIRRDPLAGIMACAVAFPVGGRRLVAFNPYAAGLAEVHPLEWGGTDDLIRQSKTVPGRRYLCVLGRGPMPAIIRELIAASDHTDAGIENALNATAHAVAISHREARMKNSFLLRGVRRVVRDVVQGFANGRQ